MSGLIKTGLVSISFRNVPAENLIQKVVRAGQQGIEWGGDVHVPHGDTARAEEVAGWTRDAGLESAAYGSYYRLAETENVPDFQAVIDSALALGTDTIRVWPGKRASEDADQAYRDAVVDDAQRICELAKPHGLNIAFEYHGGSLTDSIPSSVDLLNRLQLDNLDCLWQPPNGQSEAVCEESLRAILPRVSNVHVFHWGASGWSERYPLASGVERWTRYFSILNEDPKPRWALLEFAKDDSLEQYREDAAVLNTILASL
jgi:sugar phosphate isomerase/epimerase